MKKAAEKNRVTKFVTTRVRLRKKDSGISGSLERELDEQHQGEQPEAADERHEDASGAPVVLAASRTP